MENILLVASYLEIQGTNMFTSHFNKLNNVCLNHWEKHKAK